MRFVSFRSRNTDPTKPYVWFDQPMAVPEDPVCSRQEEEDRSWFGQLICSQDWDRTTEENDGVRACAGCRDGAPDEHPYIPLTDMEWLDRLAELEAELDRYKDLLTDADADRLVKQARIEELEQQVHAAYELMRCSRYCGDLSWTLRNFGGTMVHKHSCPSRREPYCQTHPEKCEAENGSSASEENDG